MCYTPLFKADTTSAALANFGVTGRHDNYLHHVSICALPRIRTLTELFLKQFPLPFGIEEHFGPVRVRFGNVAVQGRSDSQFHHGPKICRHAWIRTTDFFGISEILYQLSYMSEFMHPNYDSNIDRHFRRVLSYPLNDWGI